MLLKYKATQKPSIKRVFIEETRRVRQARLQEVREIGIGVGSLMTVTLGVTVARMTNMVTIPHCVTSRLWTGTAFAPLDHR